MASDFQFFSSPAKDGAAAQPEVMTPAADLIQKWGSKADRMTISVLSTPGEQLIGAKVCCREKGGNPETCPTCRHPPRTRTRPTFPVDPVSTWPGQCGGLSHSRPENPMTCRCRLCFRRPSPRPRAVIGRMRCRRWRTDWRPSSRQSGSSTEQVRVGRRGRRRFASGCVVAMHSLGFPFQHHLVPCRLSHDTVEAGLGDETADDETQVGRTSLCRASFQCLHPGLASFCIAH